MSKILHFLILLSSICLTTAAVAQTSADENAEVQQVVKPRLLEESVYLNNPMSGFYGQLDISPAQAAPLQLQPREEYEEIQWSCLENNGKYNFAFLDDILNGLPPGVKFAFRIKAFDHSIRNVKCRLDNIVPNDLETEEHGWRLPFDPSDVTKGSYFVPDWNDAAFLRRAAKLLSLLGEKYDGDPQLAWVDIGMYGTWGEWHVAGLPNYPHGIPYQKADPGYSYNIHDAQPATLATKRFIVDAHVNAFRKTQLVMMTDDGDALCYALKLPGQATHIGLRRDSLGSLNQWPRAFSEKHEGCNSLDNLALVLNRWQTAPFIAEPFGGKPARTFEKCPGGQMEQYCIEQQVINFHVATVGNSDLGSNADDTRIRWKELSSSDQQAFLSAGFHAGYRLFPIELDVVEGKSRDGEKKASRKLSISTRWMNSGVAPPYNDCNVEFSLWSRKQPDAPMREAARMISKLNVRKLLPTGITPLVFSDIFQLGPDISPGPYELRITITDPAAYMKPMQLALRGESEDGSYPLGTITINPK